MRTEMSLMTELLLSRKLGADLWIFSLILVFLKASIIGVSAQQNCDPGLQCLTCNTSSRGQQFCTSCPDAFGLTTSFPQSCQDCRPNCLQCVIGQNCTRCYPLFGPDPNSAVDCLHCTDPHCIACNSNIAECDVCEFGYAIFKNNRTCGACAPNCSSCRVNGAGQCDLCKPGYGLTPYNTCAVCADNCNTCQVNGAGKCDQCKIGYGLTPYNTCAVCDPNCNKTVGCTTAGTCKQCSLGFGLLPNQTCGPCAPNCDSTAGCNVSGTCRKCNAGYGLKPDQTCGPCDPNCNSLSPCTVTGACTLCNAGTTRLPNGTCVVSANIISSTTTTTILIPPSFAATTTISSISPPQYSLIMTTKTETENNTRDTSSHPTICQSTSGFAIGIGVGGFCGLLLIVILIIINITLLNKNRKLNKRLQSFEMTKRNGTEIEQTVSTVTTEVPGVTASTREGKAHYQKLKKEENQLEPRNYERIDQYDTIEDRRTYVSDQYERPNDP